MAFESVSTVFRNDVSTIGVVRIYRGVGAVRAVVPCWRSGPHSVACQPIEPIFTAFPTYLAAVDVPQVEGVARELHAVGPLDKRCAVSLCPQSVPKSPTPQRRRMQSLTGDLPRKVSGDSGGHFCLIWS